MTHAAPVSRHYEELLAVHYSWMSGVTFPEKVAEQEQLLEELGVWTGSKGIAIDLGSGPGYQSVALAKLGFERVVAVDTSLSLLQELESNKADLPIVAMQADMLDLAQFAQPNTVSAIVCMGDTLTHLEERSQVTRLFQDAFDALEPGGRLVLTFRDYSNPLHGLDRIIPVRSDNNRIMTCILDYEATKVVVTDLVYVCENGAWTLHKSSYEKLRLPPVNLITELEGIGFNIQFNQPVGRIHAISAAK
jgi:SAM-dependent methyltransferase